MSDAFRDMRDQKTAAMDANWRNFQALQAEFDAASKAAFLALFPRRKWSPEKASQIPNLEEIKAPFIERSKALTETRLAIETTFDERLKEVAKDAPFPKTEEMNQVHTVSAWNYHTQGFGASRYAKAAALRVTADLLFHGVQAEVRPLGETKYSNDHVGHQDYAVWANTTGLGYEMLQYKPLAPFRDVLKTLMKAGANVRVFYPSLPWGTEEKLGLDNFGDDLPGWKAAQPQTENAAPQEMEGDAPKVDDESAPGLSMG